MQKSFHKFAAKRALAKGTHVTSKSQSLGLKDSNLVMQFLVCASDSEQQQFVTYPLTRIPTFHLLGQNDPLGRLANSQIRTVLFWHFVELFGSLSLHFWN
jgi:hypothetical protein